MMNGIIIDAIIQLHFVFDPGNNCNPEKQLLLHSVIHFTAFLSRPWKLCNMVWGNSCYSEAKWNVVQLKRVHLKCSKSQVQQCGVSCTVHCAERRVWCHQHSRDIRLSLPHGSLYQVNQLFNSFQILMIALVFLLKVQNCSLWLLISCAQTRLLLRQHQWSS